MWNKSKEMENRQWLIKTQSGHSHVDASRESPTGRPAKSGWRCQMWSGAAWTTSEPGSSRPLKVSPTLDGKWVVKPDPGLAVKLTAELASFVLPTLRAHAIQTSNANGQLGELSPPA